jgi:O-antigen ligase
MRRRETIFELDGTRNHGISRLISAIRATSQPIAVVASSAYIISLALPLNVDFFLFALAIISIVLSLCGKNGDETNPIHKYGPILTFFVISAATSTAMSKDIIHSLRAITPMIPGLLLFYLITGFIRDFSATRPIYLSLLALGLMLATDILFNLWSNPASHPAFNYKQLHSTVMVVPNDSILLAIVAPVSLAIISLEHSVYWRSAALISLLLYLAVVILSHSVFGVMTLVVCYIVYWWLSPQRTSSLRTITLLILSGVLALLIDGINGFTFAEKVMRTMEHNQRIALWLVALDAFSNAPYIGHGPGTFAELYSTGLTNVHIPSWVRIDFRSTPWAHNLYLEFLAERGAFGLISFLAVIAWGICEARFSYRGMRGIPQPFLIATIAGFCGLLFASFFELSFLRIWVVVVFFVYLALIDVASTTKIKS